MKQKITHLLDDATSGGVTRVIDFMQTSEAINEVAEQELQMVTDRGRWPRFDGDIIVSHLSISWRNLPALMALRAMHPTKTLVHVEHSYTQRFTALNVPNKSRFYTLLRTAYALFDQVVCVSRSQGSWMATRALVDNSKLRIIRSAVDLSPFSKVTAPKGTPKVLGLLGRLHCQKGFDQAISAFKALEGEDLRLKVFGTGEDLESLTVLAESDPRISFEGYCTDPTKALSEIDMLLMPSRWEAYGLVAQEALAAGRRVLVTPVDGLLDQIEDGAEPITGIGTAALTSDLKRCLADGHKSKIKNREDFAYESRACFEAGWTQLIADIQGSQRLAA